MNHFNRFLFFLRWLAVCALLSSWSASRAQTMTPIPEVLGRIDLATGKPREAGEFTVHGVVGARLVLPDSRAVALVLNAGEPVLHVFAPTASALADLLPRNEVTLTGTLSEGPLGAGLLLKAGSVTVAATNKAYGASELRGASFLKDASSLVGRHVQLTNVSFVEAKFDATGIARVKSSDGMEAELRVGKLAAGRPVPAGSVDVFGFPVRTEAGWQLVAARMLTVERKELLALATKHICITCHNPDLKVVGPSYRDVAAKYRDDPEAAAKLISQMRTGGSGKWGTVPMLPFEGKVPPDDMKRLADWILGYRWDSVLAD